jgi:hypothetical protein
LAYPVVNWLTNAVKARADRCFGGGLGPGGPGPMLRCAVPFMQTSWLTVPKIRQRTGKGDGRTMIRS